MDGIFIDENPAHMEEVKNGNNQIALEYEIIYYADKHKQIGPFVYKYKNFTANGVFEEGTAEQSVTYKP